MEKILINVVVPTYRLDFDKLAYSCSIYVPENIENLFLIIVDSPSILVETYGGITIQEAHDRMANLLISVTGQQKI